MCAVVILSDIFQQTCINRGYGMSLCLRGPSFLDTTPQQDKSNPQVGREIHYIQTCPHHRRIHR
jgi:hypothetical protein